MLMRKPGNGTPSGTATAASGIDFRWRNAAVALGLVVVLQIAMFWEASATMVEIWYRSATFNHGFLILPIAGYLAWLRREQLFSAPPRPAAAGLALLALGAVVWLIADAAEIVLVQQFALIGMVQVSVLAILGWRAAIVLVFPLAYLFFAVPFGEFLVPRLQLITAAITVKLLQWVSIPVYIDGLFIQIPTGRFLVAVACSGVRFLIASVALGVLFANVMYSTYWRRGLFIGLSVIVPIIANGIRAFGIIILAHLSDNKIAVGIDHLVYGWIFFSLVILALFALGMTFRERNADRDGDDDAAPGDNAGGGAPDSSPRRLAIVAAAIAAIVVAAPVYATLRDIGTTQPGAIQIPAPALAGGWRIVDGANDSWNPVFIGADATVRRTYVKNGRHVHLYVAYFDHQRQGAELISQTNSVAGGESWQWSNSGTAMAPIDGTPHSVRTSRISGRHGRRVVWHWYWLDGSYTASTLAAKWRTAKNRLFGGSQAGAAIAIAAGFEDDPGEAAPVLRDFTRSLGPLQSSLRGVK